MLYLISELCIFFAEFRAAVLNILFVIAWFRDLFSLTHLVHSYLHEKLPPPVLVYLPHLAYFTIAVIVLRLQRQGRFARCYGLVRRILAERTPAQFRPFFGAAAVVTGGSAGIGAENVKQLAALGFRVVIVCRSRERAGAARARIVADDPDADVRVVIGDLSDLPAMKQLAKDVVAAAKAGGCFFSLLVQNAGVFSPSKKMTDVETRRFDYLPLGRRFDHLLLTNHLGPHLFVELCRPHMESFSADEASFRRSSGEFSRRASGGASSSLLDRECSSSSSSGGAGASHVLGGVIPGRWHSPRIVILSSAAHLWSMMPRFDSPSTGHYFSNRAAEQCDIWKALESHADPKKNMYGVAKTCNAMTARLIAMQQQQQQHNDDDGSVQSSNDSSEEQNAVLACSVHPGFVASSIWSWVPSGVARGAWDLLMYLYAKDELAGSQTTLHCCIAEDIVCGGYYAECAQMTPSSVVRDGAEVLAMEEWTRGALEPYL